MTINHCGELFVGLESLPLERRSPVLEEAPRPALPLVIPELPEGFLEQVSGVQSLVGSEQPPERGATLQAQTLPVGEQRVLLSLDKTALLAAQPRVLAAPHFVQGLVQVAQHVELVEQDRRLR